MLHNIVLVFAIHSMNQPSVYMCLLPLESPFHLPPPSHPIRLSEYWFQLSKPCSKFPLAIYFIYGNVIVSMLLSRFVPHSPSPTRSTDLFSVPASPLLPCK